MKRVDVGKTFGPVPGTEQALIIVAVITPEGGAVLGGEGRSSSGAVWPRIPTEVGPARGSHETGKNLGGFFLKLLFLYPLPF